VSKAKQPEKRSLLGTKRSQGVDAMLAVSARHSGACVFGAAALLAVASPAAAVQHVVTLSGQIGPTATGAGLAPGQGSADERYEFEGDFLQSHYGVPLITNSLNPGNPGRPTALPPLERLVVESRTPATGRTRGFHVPTTATGIPVADGGTGVVQALTNVPSKTRDSGQGNTATEVSRAWGNDAAIGFTLSRTGNTITYRMANGTAGEPDDVWSHTAASVAEINALQFRLRSAGQNTASLSNVSLTSGGQTLALGCTSTTVCGVGLVGAFGASAGDTHISLFDGIAGDFTLTGAWTFALTGGRAGNNAQIKLLSVPGTNAVPEPASWAMLIAGFGLTGAAMRRRRTAIA
jgi:hypothetical protein